MAADLQTPIYLDNNATTRPLPEVTNAMLPFIGENFANPSSRYPPALAARQAIEESRADVAIFIGAQSPEQIVFTSGGTESISLALSCVDSPDPLQVVISAVEHSAVLAAASRWSSGRPICSISVDRDGALDLAQLESRVSERPSFVSLVHANNETGVIFDAVDISRICRKHQAILHLDAIQSPGKLPINVTTFNCDYLSLSAHKFHGPKGIGILYVREPSATRPLMPGHHESALRGGTENVAGIVGAATALRALSGWQSEIGRITQLRDALEVSILLAIPRSALNGDKARRLCNTANIYFPQRDAADLVEQLGRRGIYVSAGAACSTGGMPSHVIQAMGSGRDRANSSLRFSLSRFTTEQEVNIAVEAVVEVYHATLTTFGIP